MLLSVGHGARFKPAVEHFGCAVVCFAIDLERDFVHVVFVKVGNGLAGELLELRNGADADHVLAIFRNPDRQAGSPVAVAGDIPILSFLEPVAKSLFADSLGHPVDRGVIGHEFVMQVFDADIPGLDGAIDQRGVRARAEGVGVDERGLVDQLAGVLEGADDRLVGILAEHAVIFGNDFGEGADIIEIVAQGNAGCPADAEVVFAKGGRGMDESGAVFGADKPIVEDTEGVIGFRKSRENGLIGQATEVGTGPRRQTLILVGLLVIGRQAGLGEDINVVVGSVAHGDVGDVRPGADGEITIEGPGGCRPDERVDRHPLGVEPGRQCGELDAYRDGGVLDILVVAAGLEIGERSIEFPGVGHDAVGLVDASLIPQLLEYPPDGLHEGEVHGLVIVIEVYPAAHAGHGFAPFLDIGQDH